MPKVEFNHTIVASHDREVSARFLAGLLDLEPGDVMGPFLPLHLEHGATLDYATVPADQEIHPQHYCFLIPEEDFDPFFARLQATGNDFWADPGQNLKGEINYHHKGRGVYFLDPSGHYMEVITSPYGTV